MIAYDSAYGPILESMGRGESKEVDIAQVGVLFLMIDDTNMKRSFVIGSLMP